MERGTTGACHVKVNTRRKRLGREKKSCAVGCREGSRPGGEYRVAGQGSKAGGAVFNAGFFCVGTISLETIWGLLLGGQVVSEKDKNMEEGATSSHLVKDGEVPPDSVYLRQKPGKMCCRKVFVAVLRGKSHRVTGTGNFRGSLHAAKRKRSQKIMKGKLQSERPLVSSASIGGWGKTGWSKGYPTFATACTCRKKGEGGKVDAATFLGRPQIHSL